MTVPRETFITSMRCQPRRGATSLGSFIVWHPLRSRPSFGRVPPVRRALCATETRACNCVHAVARPGIGQRDQKRKHQYFRHVTLCQFSRDTLWHTTFTPATTATLLGRSRLIPQDGQCFICNADVASRPPCRALGSSANDESDRVDLRDGPASEQVTKGPGSCAAGLAMTFKLQRGRTIQVEGG